MQAVPFRFDTEFRDGARAEPDSAALARESDARARIEAADAAGYERGRRDGLAEAARRDEALCAASMERVAEACAALLGTRDEDAARIERDAAELAVMAARKLAAASIARQPAVEVAAVLARCLGQVGQAPHLVVRLRAEESGMLAPLLQHLARERGFEGRLVVLGEPDIAAGDCRIEWADGGFVRERAGTEAEIDHILSRYLAGEEAGSP